MQSLLPQSKLLTCTLMLPSASKVRLHESSRELAGCWKLSWTVRHPLMRLLSEMLQAVGGPKCSAAACAHSYVLGGSKACSSMCMRV